MALSVEVLTAEILDLPANERSRLFERLIASLDTDSETEEAWAREADRREAAFESGAVQPVAGPEVFERLRARTPTR